MNNTQQSDQLTYSFLFIITPLEIVSTKTIKNLKKSILLKLGNKTQKTSQLNKPIQMPVQVLYSKTLKKYCPIKGIIKIYDINLDGSQVISSVGGFQTEQILNEQKTNIIIQRDVGTSKLKMKIQIKNLGVLKQRTQDDKNTKKQQSKLTSSRTKLQQNNKSSYQPVIIPKNIQSATIINSNSKSQAEQNKNKKAQSYFKRNSPLSASTVIEPASSRIQLRKKVSDIQKNNQAQLQINSSKQKLARWSKYSSVQNSSQYTKSQFSQNYLREKENQELGNELIEQRRKNVQLQDKICKYHIKLNQLKSKISQNQKQKEITISHFKKISQGLDIKNGKTIVQINEKLMMINIKYKNRSLQKSFQQFAEFMILEVKKWNNTSIPIEDDNEEIKMQKHGVNSGQRSQNQFKMLNQQLTKKTNQLFALRTKQRQRIGLDLRLRAKQKQCLQLQVRLKQLDILKNSLKQQNKYLKQKDETMQQIINQKENDIQTLKQQIIDIQVQYKQMESTIKNDSCQIQQLKEEVSNLNQTIENYREKYGDLKNVKNRALENQLKECLMWIDQQTRQLQMSDFAQDTEPSHSHNVSEIIKNIQIEGASRQQMNSIKFELSGLIKRIDNFLAK